MIKMTEDESAVEVLFVGKKTVCCFRLGLTLKTMIGSVFKCTHLVMQRAKLTCYFEMVNSRKQSHVQFQNTDTSNQQFHC